MARKIIWTSDAFYELKDILEFFLQRNGNSQYSRHLKQLFSEMLDYVAEYPLIGMQTEYKQVRYIVVHPNYSLFYFYTKAKVTVLTIWDNRRNPEHLETLLKGRAKEQ